MSTKAPLAYRLLLLLLPPRFRRDFSADLEAVLVERLRNAPSAAARAWIWLIAVVDVLYRSRQPSGRTRSAINERATPRGATAWKR